MENKTFYISKRHISLLNQNAMIAYTIVIIFGVLFPSWILKTPLIEYIALLPILIFYIIMCYIVILIFSRLLKQSYVKIFADHIEKFDGKILKWEIKKDLAFEKTEEIIIKKTRSGDVCSIILITKAGRVTLIGYDNMKDILSSIIDAIGDKVKIKTNIIYFRDFDDLPGRLILFFLLSVTSAIFGTIFALTLVPFVSDGTPILNGVYSLWNNSRYLFFLLIGINLLYESYSLFNLRLFSLEKDVIHLEIKNLIWCLLSFISGGILLYMSMIY
ncbi:MAG: hypothetical protein M1269_11790 [Chloroflexi bacterium]|nr:hypothetical protein [Chloroflexota bacterium]